MTPDQHLTIVCYVTHSAFSQSKYPFANQAVDSAVNTRLACRAEERSRLSGRAGFKELRLPVCIKLRLLDELDFSCVYVSDNH